MRTSFAPSDSTSHAVGEPWLEIRRGQTRAPRRDIRGRRFLIGAGSNCQLQLGGADIPILHSILLVEEDGAHIDAVVPTPQLMVNGRPQRSVDLHDGDVFSIGKFEFQVHVPRPHAALQAAPAPVEPADLAEAELPQMTATELVAAIEAEQQQVDAFENSRRLGARALLEAVHRVAATGQSASHVGQATEFVLSFPQGQLVEKVDAADQALPAARRAS